MKRLIAAAVILIAVAAITLSGRIIVTNCQREVTEKTDSILEEPTEKAAKEFKDYWDTKSIVLSAFVNREGVEAIGEHAAKMYSAAKDGNGEEARESAREIQYIMETVARNERISLQSFF